MEGGNTLLLAKSTWSLHSLLGVATISGSGQDKPRTGHWGSYDGMLQVGAEAAPMLAINEMTIETRACTR